MGTPLYTTDIIPLTSRPTLTVMDDGDYFVILDTSTGKISKILRTDVQKALNISYDNATSGLTATQVQAALDELVIDLGSADDAITAIKGVGYTEGSLKTHEDRLDTLEGADTIEGSVLKDIKDTAQDATFTDTSGLDSTTLKDAINEIYAEKAVANGLASLDATGKIPVAQLPVSAMEFKGGWDASSGAYPLTPDVGDFWTVSVAGTTEGVEFDAGDAIVYNGATWDKINKVEIAEEVSYNNSSSGLLATNVQDAIDELDERVDDTETALTTLNADDTTEGSVAKTVKDAVTPIDARVSTLENASAKRYGLRFYTDTGTFERIGDAVGMVHRNHAGAYTAGIMSDFSLHDPWRGIKPCKMNDDGQVLAWYGDGNYDTAVGDEMVFIPRCYTGWTAKTVNSRPCLDIEVSTVPLDGLYPTGFVGSDGELLRGIYVGRTKLGTSGGKLKSGAGLAPVVNKSMNSFNTDLRAKSATAKWRLHDFTAWMVTTTLMAIEIGTFDVKTAIGPGVQSGMPYGSGTEFKCTVSQTGANSIIIANAGATNMRVGMVMQVGTTYTNNSVAANRTIVSIEDYDVDNKTITLDGAVFDSVAGTTTIVSWGQPVPADQMDALNGESGYILQFDASTRSHVCWRWIWDLWGNVWERLGGVLRSDGKFYLCFDRDNYQSDPVGKAGWIDTGYAPVVENGYQKEREIITCNGGQVSLPKTTGGAGVGANSWYAAYLYNFGADYQTGVRAVRVSGDWSYGSSVSPFCWGGVGPSAADIDIGARAVIEKAS